MQADACTRMFQMQGFNPLLLNGIEASFPLPHPRTHWAWALAYLPKVLMLCEWYAMHDKDAVILAENSCWPTDRCTPARVRDVLRDALAAGASGSWIGYTGCIGKRRACPKTFDDRGCFVDVPGNCQAPRGSKLFVVTVEFLKMHSKAFERAPAHWFVDQMHHCMVASGHLVVKRPALASSMWHYSERLGKEVPYEELAEADREGEFLELGRIHELHEC